MDSQLNTIIQRRLHQSVPFQYRLFRQGSGYVASLKLHRADFYGSVEETRWQAKQNVCRLAVSYISHLNENQLRTYLGLKFRCKVSEIDTIRNALIELKIRCRALFNNPDDYRSLKSQIWRIYPIIDSVEETLVNNFYVND